MKSKKSVYILMPIALLVWGIIFYKIYIATKDNNSISIQPAYTPFEKSNSKLDTFSLIADYPDPFLKRNATPGKKTTTGLGKNEKHKKEPKNSEKSPVKWPVITFSGVIANKDARLVMIAVDGTNYVMRQKEEKSNVQLLEITSDSILVRYMGEEKFIKKQS